MTDQEKIAESLDLITETLSTVQPHDHEDILGCLIELVWVVKVMSEGKINQFSC